MIRVIYAGLVLSAGILLAAGILHAVPRPDASAYILAQVPAPAVAPAAPEQAQSRAEQVARALVEAYPGRVERAEFRGGDWAVLLRGTWFHYAGGRLMPEHLLHRAEYYSPLAFYNTYAAGAPVWRPPTEEQLARLTGMGQERATHRLPRAHYFFDTLYQSTTRAEASRHMVAAYFLGRRVNIHYTIRQELAMVEAAILETARVDPGIRAWINGIGSIYSWNWRTIGGTTTRSFHSYGIALDIIPRNLGGREMFWAWAANRRADWWNIPFDGRYHPPTEVIEAFELHGFVWGGKWLFFDTMHFEFRPEVMILNGLPLVQAP
ncbi:MAG: M15 family metallopeptidase [Spirochaetes bacterium]|nr:M15 family metallopeptidase [Spirochaetota bacterium]